MFAVFCLVPLGHALEGALLLLLFNLSHELEDALTVKARGNLRALFDSVPSKATVLKLGPDGEPDFATEQLVPAEDIAIGELVAVRAGQELALDGVVIRGEALLSMEHITGESVPQHCKVGDMVPAGAMNNDGLLIIRVATIAANSTPARMARLAREAQENKPRVQTILESIGSRYSQFVLVGTVAVALLLPLLAGIPFLGSPGSPGSLYRAACFLTTAAPCAILMGPLVYVSSIAAATQRGILLKGASVIDALAGCRVAALDKTGTLTTGALTCNHAEDLWREGPGGARAGSRNGELAAGADPKAISIVLALSQVSLHPVSKAVVEAFGPNGDGGDLPAVQLESHSVIPGRGVRGECAATGSSPPEKVFFGSQEHAESLLKELGHEAALEALRRSCGGTETGKIISLLVRESGGKLAGLHVFRFGDRLHQSSHEALNSIRSRGIKLAMLSGDNAESALAMARRLGLQEGEIRGGLRPEDKLEQVEGLRQQHGPVLMIGDGINDAPALAAADIGLAIAPTPSTTAAAAADGVILSGAGPGVSSVPFLLSLAGFTRKLVIQNFVLAGLAILGSSLPAVAGVLPLWVGVAIHEGSTLLVALNSLRPLMHRPPAPRGAKSAAPAPAEGLRSPGRRQAADADKPGDEALVFQSTAAASWRAGGVRLRPDPPAAAFQPR
eukprot:CAMPEP_0177583176 /NCGR_PEP_ID=MMETSP0419_2-20121207/3175_1 /TAXON_ID=582737 /ORGANISM="Tetraselmis sp., Strain GSL018" /LENGTH=673 /DNA_ID=CAMNT_0019072535 /DNA_START=772 /DNA_END=2791 /DNA_ORIENTATION=-